jgi:hypothetical protein
MSEKTEKSTTVPTNSGYTTGQAGARQRPPGHSRLPAAR